MSRASLRVGPTLGSHLRAMINTMMLYKYFLPHTDPAATFENAGISSNDILKNIVVCSGGGEEVGGCGLRGSD